jgi:TRAP transporter TAXI family solute receptor
VLDDLRGLRNKIFAGNWVIFTARELWWLIALIVLMVASLLYALFRYIEPPPPKVITISAGAKTGAYYQFAQRYALEMKKHGIELKVLESSGSVENLARIQDPKAGVGFALIQSGIANGEAETYQSLESLASISYEPVWVLSNPETKIARLTDLVGKRIAIGAQGSGTRPVALELLAANGIKEGNASLLPLSAADAAAALAKNEIDAMITISSPSAPLIVLALEGGASVLEFDQADAYARRYPWLAKVVLPKGSASFAKNFPSNDISLIAASANLVARTDTHRAIAFLMMDIASEVHANAGPLHNLKQFPNEQNLQFSQSEESKRFFKTGRPVLQRYLPFWLANLIERLLVSIVPALAIGIPLAKLIPAFFEYREKAAVLLLYDEADGLDKQQQTGALKGDTMRQKLDDIEARLGRLKLGASRHVDVYNLRGHLDVLRARIKA